MDISELVFYSPTRGRVAFGDVVLDIVAEITKDAAQPLRIGVGTDSEELAQGAKFVSVIHIWRVGRGARAYYATEIDRTMRLRERTGTSRFRERIYKEVMMTATLAVELRTALHDRYGGLLPQGVEVHADVGERGGSSVMLKEVIGVLQGYGFGIEEIFVKPDAFVASTVADRVI